MAREPHPINNVSRAEWISFAVFCLNIATLVFGLGVVRANVQDRERLCRAQIVVRDC